MTPTTSTISIEPLSPDSSAQMIETAKRLLGEYGEFVLASTGPARFCAARLDGEIEDPLDSYLSQRGELLLAFQNAQPAGCAGFRLLKGSVPEHACELKRMWVRPAFRGGTVGRKLAEAVIERAAFAAYEAIYLDTEPEAMPAALRLYQRLGFEECANYSNDTVGGLLFLRRPLP